MDIGLYHWFPDQQAVLFRTVVAEYQVVHNEQPHKGDINTK